MSRAPLVQARALAAGLVLLALAGCGQFDRLMEASFPPEVPGLPEGQPWVALPIGGWVTEGEVSADAIAACFAADCGERAGVGVFRAEGEQAATLQEIVAHPDLLAARLEAESRIAKGKRKPQPVVAAVQPLSAGALKGFSLHLARTDGSHSAYGALLISNPAGGRMTALIIFAASQAAIERVAQSVAPRVS